MLALSLFSLQCVSTPEAHCSLIPDKQGRLIGAAFKATGEKKFPYVYGTSYHFNGKRFHTHGEYISLLFCRDSHDLKCCNKEIHFTLDGLVLHSSTHTPALQIKMLNQHFSSR